MKVAEVNFFLASLKGTPLQGHGSQLPGTMSSMQTESIRNMLLRSEAISPHNLQSAVDLNSKLGSSSWLLALPSQDQSFHLYKQEFWGTLHLCYGWTLLNTPSYSVCGTTFIAAHAMICQHGGLTFVHHNDVHDITAELTLLSSNVAIESPLQPLSGEILTPGSAN